MWYALLADLIVLAHGLFVLFVVAGGLAVLRWNRLALLHIPAAVWGVTIELWGWGCPLTYLENRLRQAAGGPGYQETFIRHYLESLLYPLGLTRETQVLLGIGAAAVNMAVYLCLWFRYRRKKRAG